MRLIFSITVITIGLFMMASCRHLTRKETVWVMVNPDSVLNGDTSNRLGINVNFFMDGGRFPHPKHSLTEALDGLGVGFIRYPGGEKSDLYLFSKPPYEKSEPTLARTGALADYPGVITDGSKLTYDPLDFDEFMATCRAVHAEPVIVVAADSYLLDVKSGEKLTSRSGLITNAVEWVKYANIKKKYNIRYWMIGNESWNTNNVNSTPSIYARDVVDFSKAMKAVDPSIIVIANGNEDDFFKTVISVAGNCIDRLCASNYGVWNFSRGYQTYRDTVQCLIWPALTAIRAMNAHATPEQLKRLKIIVAEFGTIDWKKQWKGTNDIGHAIVTFDMAGQLLAQPLIEFSCFWNTRWIENEKEPTADHDAIDKDGNLNPTGKALAMWGKFPPKKLVATAVHTNDSVHSPVIAYSGFDPLNMKLRLYLINKSEKPVNVGIEIHGYKAVSVVQALEYFGTSPEDTRPVWQKKNMQESIHNVDIKGLSVSMIEMAVEKVN